MAIRVSKSVLRRISIQTGLKLRRDGDAWRASFETGKGLTSVIVAFDNATEAEARQKAEIAMINKIIAERQDSCPECGCTCGRCACRFGSALHKPGCEVDYEMEKFLQGGE